MSIYFQIRKAVQKSIEYANFLYPETFVILSHQNGEEPLDTYIAVDIDSVEEVGKAIISTLTNENNEILIQATYEIDVNLNFVGKLSGEMSHDMLLHLKHNPLVKEKLQSEKVDVVRTSKVTRIPQPRNGKWVEYHNMSVTFRYGAIHKQLVGVIEQVDLVSTVVVGDTSESTSFSVTT